MKKYEVTWFGEKEDVKFFRSNGSRIAVFEFAIEDLNKVENSYIKDLNFKSGLYILEGIDQEEEMKLYVGESDNVPRRIKEHIEGKSQLKNKYKRVERVIAIFSTDLYDEFQKHEIQFIESKIIKELDSLGQKLINGNQGFNKNINSISVQALEEEFETIKKAFYFLGKDYFINTFSTNDEIINTIPETKEEKWIEVFPLLKAKSKVECQGTFSFSQNLKKIKVSANASFKGQVNDNSSNRDILSYNLNKLVKEEKAEGFFDPTNGQYELIFLKEILMSVSTIGIFARAGVNNGWTYWKDKEGKLLNKYRIR